MNNVKKEIKSIWVDIKEAAQQLWFKWRRSANYPRLEFHTYDYARLCVKNISCIPYRHKAAGDNFIFVPNIESLSKQITERIIVGQLHSYHYSLLGTVEKALTKVVAREEETLTEYTAAKLAVKVVDQLKADGLLF